MHRSVLAFALLILGTHSQNGRANPAQRTKSLCSTASGHENSKATRSKLRENLRQELVDKLIALGGSMSRFKPDLLSAVTSCAANETRLAEAKQKSSELVSIKESALGRVQSTHAEIDHLRTISLQIVVLERFFLNNRWKQALKLDPDLDLEDLRVQAEKDSLASGEAEKNWLFIDEYATQLYDSAPVLKLPVGRLLSKNLASEIFLSSFGTKKCKRNLNPIQCEVDRIMGAEAEAFIFPLFAKLKTEVDLNQGSVSWMALHWFLEYRLPFLTTSTLGRAQKNNFEIRRKILTAINRLAPSYTRAVDRACTQNPRFVEELDGLLLAYLAKHPEGKAPHMAGYCRTSWKRNSTTRLENIFDLVSAASLTLGISLAPTATVSPQLSTLSLGLLSTSGLSSAIAFASRGMRARNNVFFEIVGSPYRLHFARSQALRSLLNLSLTPISGFGLPFAGKALSLGKIGEGRRGIYNFLPIYKEAESFVFFLTHIMTHTVLELREFYKSKHPIPSTEQVVGFVEDWIMALVIGEMGESAKFAALMANSLKATLTSLVVDHYVQSGSQLFFSTDINPKNFQWDVNWQLSMGLLQRSIYIAWRTLTRRIPIDLSWLYEGGWSVVEAQGYARYVTSDGTFFDAVTNFTLEDLNLLNWKHYDRENDPHHILETLRHQGQIAPHGLEQMEKLLQLKTMLDASLASLDARKKFVHEAAATDTSDQ